MGDASKDGKDRVYHDEPLNSKNINICQFECNPHLETTIWARLNPKHVDKRARVVQETAKKISQTIRYWWHVRTCGRVGPDARKIFRWVSGGKVGTIAIVILLDILHEMIWFDRYVEKKGPTHWSKGVCLCCDRFGNSVILVYVHIWDLRDVWILSCVSKSEGKLNITLITITYKWWRVVVRCIVIGCIDVSWMMHFTLHNHRLRDTRPIDTLLVITSHTRILKYEKQ